ncbi:MAG: acylphosphatase [Chitinophagaceae bacterium]
MATVHLMIRGKVQGVFYRATARQKAEELGLSGWVKNTADESVEATISGTPEAVDAFIAWCWQGPPRAQVAHVQVTPKPDTGLTGFEVIRG